MTLLALDTSTEWASVAIYDGRDVLAEETWHAQRRHADELFPTIERLLARARITLASVDKVAVATGPGSFTGLRVAIAAAQGIARGAGAARLQCDPDLDATAGLERHDFAEGLVTGRRGGHGSRARIDEKIAVIVGRHATVVDGDHRGRR